MAVFVLDKKQKQVNGFRTGNQIVSSVSSLKKKGDYVAQVALRAFGKFNLQTADGVVQGISSKYLRLIANGYQYLGLIPPPPTANFNTLKKEGRLPSVLKGWVFAPSLR